ncbi:MAG: DegV family protein [Dehalococcoidales bacterium]|jgi:DegV family protein with EDD domain|nr:DegV family protein [Dehalococcoidales bacterium]
MTIKIMADSLGDIPADVVKDLDITIIPIHVLFGTTSYRDGVDLTTEQFYEKLVNSKTLPTSAVPSLGTFIEYYEQVAEKTDEIIVCTISHKLSGTFETATRAAEMVKKKCRIKVIDTLQVIMGEGLITIEAARAAKAGESFENIVKLIEHNMKRVEPRMAFDTLEYLKRGGRIGAAQAFLGSVLKINPVLCMKDGEIYPFARERSRAKAIESLYNFTSGFSKVDALAVEDATTPAEADALANRLKEKFPGVPLYRSKVSAVIGVHVGPSVIAVTVLGDRKQ